MSIKCIHNLIFIQVHDNLFDNPTGNRYKHLVLLGKNLKVQGVHYRSGM